MEMVSNNVGSTTKAKRDRRLHVSTVRILGISLVVLIFIFTFSYATAWASHMKLVEAQSSTDVFKVMNLKTLDGDTFTIENFKDAKVTLINVWGTTCAPCIKELPELEELNHSYAPGEIQVIGMLEDSVNSNGEVIQQNLKDAKGLCEKAGVTYPTLIIDSATYSYLVNSTAGTPTTFFIDSDGNIIKVVTGANDLAKWKGHVDEALSMVSQ